jgi:aminopeptidase N
MQGYLSALGEPEVTEQLLRRFKEATNMTDEISALAALDRAGERMRFGVVLRTGSLDALKLSCVEHMSSWRGVDAALFGNMSTQRSHCA